MASTRRSIKENRKTQRAEARPTSATFVRALVITLAILVTYANSLNGPFILDDNSAVAQNEDIRMLSRLGDVLLPSSDSPVAGRPLVSLSFAVNYAVGGLDVRGYHAVNVALHIVCALLVFGLLRRT